MDIKTIMLAKLIGGITGLLLSAPAFAQNCCPGGSGSPLAKGLGLGEQNPKAQNLALDPAWAIYEFQRDGVSYLQINDVFGTVRAAVGNIEGTLWVLPMGIDADHVTVGNSPATSPPRSSVPMTPATIRLVYRTPTFTVHVQPEAAQTSWLISPSN